MKRTADGPLKDKRPTTQKKFNKKKNQMVPFKPLSITPEKKWRDQFLNGPPPPLGTWLRYPINGMTVGGSPNQRVGRKVVWTSLDIKGSFFIEDPQTNGNAGTAVRILVIYDKQTNGATPLVTDVLTSDSFNAHNNLNNRDRFLTLVDQVSPVFGASGDAGWQFHVNRKFTLETIFNANGAGDVGDINTGSIIVMYSQAQVNTIMTITTALDCRLRFVDF